MRSKVFITAESVQFLDTKNRRESGKSESVIEHIEDPDGNGAIDVTDQAEVLDPETLPF